nr:transcription factor Maf-like [Symphalangus syndactylus]
MGHHVRGHHGRRGRLPSGDARVNAEPAEREDAGAGGPGGGSSLPVGCGRYWSEAGGGGGGAEDIAEYKRENEVYILEKRDKWKRKTFFEYY